MKKPDLTNSVMKTVTRFERRRVRRWLLGFVVVVGILTLVFIDMASLAVQDMVDRQVLEPLQVFWEDREIIADYWREVVDTFFVELPMEHIVVGAVVLIVLAVFVIVTRRRRDIIQKKLKSLGKYS